MIACYLNCLSKGIALEFANSVRVEGLEWDRYGKQEGERVLRRFSAHRGIGYSLPDPEKQGRFLVAPNLAPIVLWFPSRTDWSFDFSLFCQMSKSRTNKKQCP